MGDVNIEHAMIINGWARSHHSSTRPAETIAREKNAASGPRNSSPARGIGRRPPVGGWAPSTGQGGHGAPLSDPHFS